jgi:hypothetical protein
MEARLKGGDFGLMPGRRFINAELSVEILDGLRFFVKMDDTKIKIGC